MNQDRRTKEGLKLRIYIDAIRDAQLTSDEEWLTMWAIHGKSAYVDRGSFISYLEQEVVKEAEIYFGKKAA